MSTEATLPPIVEEIIIDASIDAVWRVMTEEAPIWLGCLRYRMEIGSVFFMQQDRGKAMRDDITGATQCEILALDAPTLFKFSWFVPGFPATFVSFALNRVEDRRTLVLLSHEGWDRFLASAVAPIREALLNGWRSFVLPGLKKAAERSGGAIS